MLDNNTKIEILRKVSFFSDTSEKNLATIALSLSSVFFEPEQSVFCKGDEGDSMYIIVEGKVKVHDGNHVFTSLSNGQFFGEFSLLDSNTRSASVTAIEATELLKLDQDTFYQIMTTNIEVYRGVLKSIIKRLYAKDDLEAQLAQKNAEIQRQNAEIEFKNVIIEKKNENITASITYAKRIQQAILPSKELINRLLPESFILFMPKDIVSGDFYWLTEKDGKVLFSAVDCTGHGVPGGFMSIVGNSLLRRAVNEHNLSKPSLILDALSKGINEMLRQTNAESSVKDGMDLVLCALDWNTLMLEFAGVHNPLYVIRGEEVLLYKGDNYPIGEPFSTMFTNYTNYEMQLYKGDTLYVFSDGYVDQIGGESKKKFMTKNFREMLQKIQHLSMPEQKEYLEEAINKWKSDYPQVDDILVIGVRI